jgi:hypothetical protein
VGRIEAQAMFPVEKILPDILASLERNRTVVLRSPPGSGKTTCVPPFLLDAKFLGGKKILMLEPRRLAARSSASFIAGKLNERVGERVGYQVRLERKVSAATRLEIVTEGLLAQRILNDPELSDVGLIIFDEFHERSLACDFGFALALDVRRALRDDLRILVMSATLEVEPIAEHLQDADIHTAEARMFPVETRFLREEPLYSPIHSTVASAVKRVLARTGKKVEVMVYGDGAFKDPQGKIWELADPVVSPAYTDGLIGTPNELKLKYLADNDFADLSGEELKAAISASIKAKDGSSLVGNMAAQGTTPRQLTDLIGPLCDLTSGSGDKGTPVVLVQGYFDNYTN